jgi:4'-phosphopantetheinyl transferase
MACRLPTRRPDAEKAVSVSDLLYPGNGAACPPRRLQSPRDDVELWWCTLAADDASFAALAGWLSAAEQARAARYGSDALSRRYAIGRAALRWILAARLGIDPADVPIQRGLRGRPQLAPPTALDFNVSNTRGIALIAVCDTPGVRVGVDVEHADRAVHHSGLARKFLSAREQSNLVGDDDRRRQTFLRLWTCKEAMSKATGDALSAPFRRLDVELGPPPRLVDGPAPYLPRDWALLPADVPESFIGTLACWQVAAPA